MKSKFKPIAASVLAIALGSTGAVSAQDAAWPTSQITFVVALGTGGSADRTARLVAQEMQEELGVPIRVINQEGGGGHVGHTYFMNMPADGSYFLASSIHPYISSAILDFNADYSLDDFAFVNGQWTDIDLFGLSADLPFETLEEFMDAIAQEPGRYRISVVPGSTGLINTIMMLEAFGLSESDVNIVTYESGNAARTAAAGGQVDMTVLGAEGTLPIAEYIKPLAVASDERLPTWDAPTLNEVLAERGIEVPPLVGSMRGIAAHAEFRDNHPELFERFTAAYQAVLEDEEFAESLASQGIGAEWLGPDRTTAIIESNLEILERFQD
ncbi:Bug family tripartite tricarboxylate transporter substrate binding protein [Pelagibacterium luteolum]|uniref:Tripartite-type tricarboxylate transporter, receptor component TctC n=1 Tax=Pelagibacterium luteolum TaxID=440168 RepID=A0A1G7XV89_9HYPH|nr:tripartite tricarboxylate transporter substrate binding protein [Pelagibacterium luteolum]SDG87973.1 Tripartite-type tricarboxylate transporter, receptor component TctC [Pelagibacterium luteolum]